MASINKKWNKKYFNSEYCQKKKIGFAIKGSDLINKIINTTPFGIALTEETTCIMKYFKWKDVCHVKVHYIKTKYTQEFKGQMPVQYL